jgi:hypothetical protein
MPDFFIVGAPKCATTALYGYLKEHPDIFMPEKKEPHYYAPELSDFFVYYRDEDDYMSLFEPAEAEQKCGEASVMYLRSDGAVERILKEKPDAKLIAMVRNPVDAAISFHLQNIKSAHEDQDNFKKAWMLQDKRAQGHAIPKRCTDPDMLQYRDLFALGSQIERFMEKVPEDRRMIIVYDDFKKNTEKVYKDVLAFLGVAEEEQKEFPVINPTTGHMSPLLEKRLAAIKAKKVPVLGPILYFFKRIWIYYIRPALRPGYAPPPPAKPPQEVYAMLEQHYRAEIEKLEKLLDRDLQHWFKYS